MKMNTGLEQPSRHALEHHGAAAGKQSWIIVFVFMARAKVRPTYFDTWLN